MFICKVRERYEYDFLLTKDRVEGVVRRKAVIIPGSAALIKRVQPNNNNLNKDNI